MRRAIAVWFVLASPLALAQAPSAAPAEHAPHGIPKSVEALFQEKGPDGTPILGDAERAALMKIPGHTLERIASEVDELLIGGAQHLKILLSLELSPQSAELVFTDRCLLCHSDPAAQKKRNLLSPDPKAAGTPEHLDLKEALADVHFRHGLSCSGCHGGSPQDTEMTDPVFERWPGRDERAEDKKWVVEFCGRCHSDPAFMRGFNPALPTDQVSKYQFSRHGVALLQRNDSKVAQCVSCHGAHGIRGPKSRKSMVHAQRLPDTCGACHASAEHMAGYKKDDGTPLKTTQVADFKASVHGKALLERGDLGAPACNDCHGNHAAMPLKVSAVAQVCRTCHTRNGTLFDGSKHKLAFEKNGWPECGKCHGEHAIAKTGDHMLSAEADGLCGSCHAEHAQDKDQCNDGVRYFRTTLDYLAGQSRSLAAEAEHAAERGLDVDAIVAAVSELDESVVESRSRIHAFDDDEFDVSAHKGREAAARAEAMVAAAREEHRFRRNGLLAAIGSMGLLAFGLMLKIRDLDRKRKEQR